MPGTAGLHPHFEGLKKVTGAEVTHCELRKSRGRPCSARRVLPLDSCEDVFTRRCVPVLLLHVCDQRIRELVGVAAREALLAAWAPHYELVHAHQSHRFT